MNTPDKPLMNTLRRLLRPVVRLLVKKNVTIQLFVDELKALYVEEAEASLLQELDKATDSHISLITGVHRKDVKVYRNKTADNADDSKHVSVGAELLARWVADPKYAEGDGKPRVLSYKDKSGATPSFVTLAESVSSDIPPRAIMDEMLRQNFVEYDELADKVVLRAEAFLPQKDFEDKLYYLRLNGGDHLEAAVTNLLADKPPFLDRSVYHDGLTEQSVADLRKMAVEGAMKLLRQINREAFKCSEQDKGNRKAHFRINLGTYLFAADTTNEDDGEPK